jgi:pSer/pThr/pTyr-binding forkhead associated (FHA) protein
MPHGKKRLTIGRDRKNDVVLADTAVSRQHAEIFPGLNGFYIRDLRSSNGVLVNQTRIANPYQLTHGDRIVIGSSACYFVQLQTLPTLLPVAVSTPSRTCSTCGSMLENPSAHFCPYCGSPLGQAYSEGR